MHDCGGGGWNNIYECIGMQVAIRLLDKRAAWFCILYEIVGKYQACMTLVNLSQSLGADPRRAWGGEVCAPESTVNTG